MLGVWISSNLDKNDSVKRPINKKKGRIQMSEIIKAYKQEVSAMRFIGKKYGDYSHWGEWFQNGWFDQIENAMGGVDSIVKIWEDGGGYVGMECYKEDAPFEYWIGMFTPADTGVPEGFSYMDFEACNLGVCWIYGKEDEVHGAICRCREELEKNGMKIVANKNGAILSFENGTCPRFTTPDEKGNVILDFCYFVE